MSDTGQNRFEIDLEEIERQLRRSAEMPATATSANSDPLAELARIVGQDDPFIGILGDQKQTPAVATLGEPPGEPDLAVAPRPLPRSQVDAVLTREDRDVLGTEPLADGRGELSVAPEPFDPVARAYGSPENSLDTDEFAPLPPRRSRRRLGAALALVTLGVAGTAGVLAWRNGGASLVSSGPPPLIRADNSPLKVAPENPGGIDIPNQNKQIYERSAETGRSRVLNRQEEPIDVREAARSMPAPEAPATPALRAGAAPSGTPTATPPANSAPSSAVASATPGASAPLQPFSPVVPSAPVPAPTRVAPPASEPAASPAPAVAAAPGPAAPSATPAPPSATPAAPAGRNPVLNALGEPRRVRTVSVRPDGTTIGASGPAVASDPAFPLIPTTQLPPPVSVPTVSIPANSSPTASVSTPTTPPSDGATPPAGSPVQVLPPQRPRSARGADASDAVSAPEQTTGAVLPTGGQANPAGGTSADAGSAQAGAASVAVQPPARPSRAAQRVAAASPNSSIAELPEQQGVQPATGGRTYAVQLAVRPTEEAARAAYDQLADKYATELGGKPATVTRADVSGRAVYRIRVTPLSREEANTLCTRLKASGGQCFVAAN